jgi:DNA ligase-1
MKRFAALFTRSTRPRRPTAKTAALAAYFADAPEDRLWTIALLSGRRPRRTITTTKLREWAAERAGIPLWLFEACYPVVGDLAETIALVLPPNPRRDLRRAPRATGSPRSARSTRPTRDTRKAAILTPGTGWMRPNASSSTSSDRRLPHGRQPEADDPGAGAGHRDRRGRTRPPPDGRLDARHHSWSGLVEAPDPTADLSRPTRSTSPTSSTTAPEALGVTDWLAERKWDGIRGQLILRGGGHFVWSRGEELMTDRFPELAPAARLPAPRHVIDGEVLAWDRRRAPALQRAAAPDRAQDRAEKAAGRGAGDPDGLRPAGMGRRRHARRAPCRAPRATGNAGRPAPEAPLRLSPRVVRRTGTALAEAARIAASSAPRG